MNSPDLKGLGEEFVNRLQTVDRLRSDVDLVASRPSGPPVSLDQYRAELSESRINSLGKPGIYLDRSPTGSGKSYADKTVVALADRSLIATSTHQQCGEIVDDLKADGIDAFAYVKRTTSGDEQNCWNELADDVERAGLPVANTVCRTCPHHATCSGQMPGAGGYLKQHQQAKLAQVVVLTHKRITLSGFDDLTAERDYVSIHEDATDVLFPSESVTRESIQQAQAVVQTLLDDPHWLDWFGEVTSRDDDGELAPDPAEELRRDTAYRFILHIDQTISDLLTWMDAYEETAALPVRDAVQKPQQIEWLLWEVHRQLGVTFADSPPWRALLMVCSDSTCSAIISVDHSGSGDALPPFMSKRLIVTRRNLPNPESTVWLADATAQRELLEAGFGVQVQDMTPHGNLALQQSVQQIEWDITRSTSPARFRATLRGVLHDYSSAQRVGVITHLPLKDAVRSIGEPFHRRISRVAHFGSGEDRASNSWYRDCDLVVVAGTPRVPTHNIRQRLLQYGLIDAATGAGEWSKLRWKGFHRDGSSRIVAGRGYRNEHWQMAHRSIVRANLIQAAGRGRGLSVDGCDVVILSNEECGFPLSDQDCVQPIPDEAVEVLAALTAVSAYRDILALTAVSTAEVAEQLGRSERQTRDWLRWLSKYEFILRKGKRGGWVLRHDHSELN